MNITLEIPDPAADAWALRLANYNAGSGSAPVDLTGLLQIELDIETEKRLVEKATADNAALAENTALLALGRQVNALSEADQAIVLAATQAAVASLTKTV